MINLPLFLDTTGLTSPSGLSIASGGGLVASSAGVAGTATIPLPAAIDQTRPWRMAVLMECGADADNCSLALTNSAETSYHGAYFNFGGTTFQASYGGGANFQNTGIAPGKRYWGVLASDGLVVTISMIPYHDAGLGTFGFAIADPSCNFRTSARGYTNGGQSVWDTLNQINISNASATAKILGVYVTQGLAGGTDSRLTPPAPFALTLTDGDNTCFVRLPKQYDGVTPCPIVMVMHPNASDELSGCLVASSPDSGAAIAALVDAGYIVATSRGTNDYSGTTYSGPLASNWGGPAGMQFRRDLLSWLKTNLVTGNVYAVGQSMGLMNALDLVRTGDAKAAVGISGVCSLGYSYNTEGFAALINAGWGVSDYADLPSYADPVSNPTNYKTSPILLYHGTADSTLSKTHHADAFAAAVNAVGGDVQVVAVSGADHLSSALLWDGAAMIRHFAEAASASLTSSNGHLGF